MKKSHRLKKTTRRWWKWSLQWFVLPFSWQQQLAQRIPTERNAGYSGYVSTLTVPPHADLPQRCLPFPNRHLVTFFLAFMLQKCSTEADCGKERCCLLGKYCSPKLPKYSTCFLTVSPKTSPPLPCHFHNFSLFNCVSPFLHFFSLSGPLCCFCCPFISFWARFLSPSFADSFNIRRRLANEYFSNFLLSGFPSEPHKMWLQLRAGVPDHEGTDHPGGESATTAVHGSDAEHRRRKIERRSIDCTEQGEAIPDWRK